MIGLLLTVVVFSTLLASGQDAGWLDRQPLRDWNSTSNRLPRPDRRERPEVATCKRYARPAAFAQDRQLMQVGMWPVGPAHVFGSTLVITAAKDFDGMCRPLEFQTFVFRGSRLVGTLSPEFMNSRTDGALVNVRLFDSNSLEAEYARYRSSDALCCPYRTQKVGFDISEDPTGVLSVINGAGPAGGISSAAALVGTKWRWEINETPARKITVANPADYTIEFNSGGIVQVKSDCNSGRGRYIATSIELTFSGIRMTRVACPRGSQGNLFNRSLSDARVYRREGDKLFVDMVAEAGTMHFTRVN